MRAGGQLRGDRATGGRDSFGERLDRAGGLLDLGLDRGQALVGGLERRDLVARAVQEGDHLRIRRPVFSLQASKGRDAFAHLLEPRRVDRHPLAVGAHLGCEVGDLGGKRVTPTGERGRVGIEIGGGLEVVGGRCEQIGRPAVASEGASGRIRQLLQPLGMPELRRFAVERLALVGLRRDGFDLSHLIREEVEHPLAIARRIQERLELAPRRLQAGVRGAIRPDELDVRRPRIPIQERRLGRAVEEPQGLMLTVDLDQMRTHVRERGGRRELAADARRAAAIGDDRPRQDDLAVLGPFLGPRRRIEPRLDLGRPLPRPHELCVAAPPEGQGNADRDHRLARAGLPGEHGEPGGRLDVELTDHAQAGDVQLTKHERILASPTDTPRAVGQADASVGSSDRSNFSRTRASERLAPGPSAGRTHRASWMPGP